MISSLLRFFDLKHQTVFLTKEKIILIYNKSPNQFIQLFTIQTPFQNITLMKVVENVKIDQKRSIFFLG